MNTINLDASKFHLTAHCCCGWNYQLEQQFSKIISNLDKTIFNATVRRHKQVHKRGYQIVKTEQAKNILGV